MPVTDVTTDPEALTMTLTADFDAPVERLWAAFTEPLGSGGSLVLVTGRGSGPALEQELARIAEVERVTPPGRTP